MDDLALASNSRRRLDEFKTSLMEEFEMKDLGMLHWFLGMRVTRDRNRRTLSIDQSQYIDKIVSEHRVSSNRTAWTPMEGGREYVQFDGKSEIAGKYQSLIGSLMYAMCGTRADIAYSVGTLSRFNHNPSSEHHHAALRVLKYLDNTRNFGITYGLNKSVNLVGYSDSGYAGDKDNRRSTAGYVYMFNGGGISWKSKLQSTTAMSSTEAEYMGLGQATKEALWIMGLMEGLGMKKYVSISVFSSNQRDLTTIFSDSMGAIDLAKTTKHHDRTKHIDVRHHFLREHVEKGHVAFQHVRTEFMWADIMTKALGKIKFMACRDGMGIQEV